MVRLAKVWVAFWRVIMEIPKKAQMESFRPLAPSSNVQRNPSYGKSITNVKFSLFAALLVLAAPALVAQQPAPAAPIPAPILSAQKVFLANGGADLVSANSFRQAGQVDEPYRSTYNALQAWGHWQLVSAPDSADLVLVVRFTAPADSYSKGSPIYAPQIELTIFDGKSHFPLWTLTQPVKGAFRKATWEKNYADGISGLMDQLKSLTASPAP